jgi:hypothetical protein
VQFIAALVLSLTLTPALMADALPSASPSPSAAESATPAPAPAPPVVAPHHFDVVDPHRLIILLPDPPTGWSADKPEGITSESGGYPITTVGCVYVEGDADDAPTATVNIIDSANNQQFQDATKAMWGATSNGPQGYDKAVTVNGLPGFEHYSNVDHTGVLWVIAAGRFFVQVETTHLPPTDLETWLNLIDLKTLSTLR